MSQSPIQIQLPTIYGMRTVNAYLFTEPEPVLIDCGEKTKKSWETLQAGLKENGLGIQDIRKVIVTHAHVDHMGMAAEICRHSDAEIWVSEYVQPWAIDIDKMWKQRNTVIGEMIRSYLRGSDKGQQMLQLFADTGQMLMSSWENVPENRLKVFPMTGMLEFGGRNWETLYMPGHCIHQSCFYHQGSGDFISADMLLRITPTPVIEMSIAPPYKRVKGILQLLESFKRLKQMDIKTVYPGHYGIFQNAQEIIRHQITRIHTRKDECLALINQGNMDFFEVFEKMYGDRLGVVAFPMMLGYLDLLEDEGKIQHEVIDGIMRISPSIKER